MTLSSTRLPLRGVIVTPLTVTGKIERYWTPLSSV